MQNYTFKTFLLNEQSAYLGQKVGDILTAVQELRDDSKNMGTRDLIRYSERIVNQIRRILHSNWPREETKNLKVLQKIGVAFMNSIEKKDNLAGKISGAASDLEKLVAKLGMPVNKLAATEQPEAESATEKGTSEKEEDKLSAPPPQPKMIDTAAPATPPAGGTGQDLATPALGGSAGPLGAF